MFVVAISFFSGVTFSVTPLSVTPLKRVSINNQECKARSEIININRNEPLSYLYSIKIDKCIGSCNNTNDPNAKLFVPDVIKNRNVKIFNLVSRTNDCLCINLTF